VVENNLLLATVLAILGFVFIWEELNAKFFQFGRPLMAGTATGLIIGDLRVGLAVGATLELIALGVYTYGGATIPDYMSGAMLGTVFGSFAGMEPRAAVGLAIPIALLLTQLDVLARLSNTFFQHRADAYAAKANADRVGLMNILGTIPWGLSRAIPIFLGVWLGSALVEDAVNAAPEWLLTGLQTAGGILPALGIALLLRLLPVKRFWPFLLIGFVAAAYLDIALVGVAIFGVALAALVTMYGRPREETA